MTAVDTFKRMFAGASLDAEDLFLLESFQIAYLPGWVPERELAAVLWAHPAIQRYLSKRCPAVEDFLQRVMAEHPAVEDGQELATCKDTLVWTIADLLVYNKCPETYDQQPFHAWDFGEVTTITPLTGKVVIDGGAGTGRVTLEAAQTAALVYAVEPVTRARQFIRSRAAALGLRNVFVVDGFLHALPFPDHFADVLLTSHALGWQLDDELAEFERVVKPGGTIIHCPGTVDQPQEDPIHTRLVSVDWRYDFAVYTAPDAPKRKYWKHL